MKNDSTPLEISYFTYRAFLPQLAHPSESETTGFIRPTQLKDKLIWFKEDQFPWLWKKVSYMKQVQSLEYYTPVLCDILQ